MQSIVIKQAIEYRAFNAAQRVFGRYGIDVTDPNVTLEMLQAVLKRMNAKEHTTVIGAFGAVMHVHGRMRPSAPAPLKEEEVYKKLQERAYHFKNHPEDLPKELNA